MNGAKSFIKKVFATLQEGVNDGQSITIFRRLFHNNANASNRP